MAVDATLGLRLHAFIPVVESAAMSACLVSSFAAVAQMAPLLALAALAWAREIPARIKEQRLDSDSLIDQVVGGLLVVQEDHPAPGLAAVRESVLWHQPPGLHNGFGIRDQRRVLRVKVLPVGVLCWVEAQGDILDDNPIVRNTHFCSGAERIRALHRMFGHLISNV